MIELSIDPEKSGRYRKESLPEHEDTCTMCGKMCAMKTMKKILNGEEVDI
jgi:phosphomethylpyrimidine synthase